MITSMTQPAGLTKDLLSIRRGKLPRMAAEKTIKILERSTARRGMSRTSVHVRLQAHMIPAKKITGSKTILQMGELGRHLFLEVQTSTYNMCCNLFQNHAPRQEIINITSASVLS